MSQPNKKSGLKVEMDIAQGKVQGLANTGKYDPGRGSAASGESGQGQYAEMLPDQYHPSSDLGDPSTGFGDTGAGIKPHGNNPVPTFDFGAGADNDPGDGFQDTGVISGKVEEVKYPVQPDEPVKGGQSTVGGAFTPDTNPNLLQPGALNFAKAQPTINQPGTLNTASDQTVPGIVNRSKKAAGDAGMYGINSDSQQ